MHLVDQWLDEFSHNYEHLQYVAYRNHCEARLKTPLCKDEFLKKIRQRRMPHDPSPARNWLNLKFWLKRNHIVNKMRQLSLIMTFSAALAVSPLTFGQASYNWNNSPDNWNNSSNNWNNSPNNWNNSPNNWNNSPNNYSSSNGVFDNRGNRIGYEVPSPTGVINYFDNNGNRIGYKPSAR